MLHAAAITSCALALVVAAVSDLRHRIIPDAASLVILIAGAVALGCGSHTVQALLPPVLIAFAAFGAGTACFALGVLGGGDVKLLAAFGLWLTPSTATVFLSLMAVLGALLAIGVLVRRRLGFGVDLSDDGEAAAEPSVTVPYGVAIAVSGLFILFGAQ